jgi:hypothetical protein
MLQPVEGGENNHVARNSQGNRRETVRKGLDGAAVWGRETLPLPANLTEFGGVFQSLVLFNGCSSIQSSRLLRLQSRTFFDFLILHTAALRPWHIYRHFHRLPAVM